jgi:NAD(P)-dependent dehydrogenase (short-subunit alcohol dehydrogenase family)
MKVAITGYKKGLGKALYERFRKKVGISKEDWNTCDLSTLIPYLKDCDVFINNAPSGFIQTEVLYRVFEEWKNEQKTIVNIISRSKYPNISKGFLYSSSKASLSHLSNSLRFISDKKCRIIDINLGLLNSELPSLSFSEAANLIEYVIRLPFHIEVGEISAWNTVPYSVISKEKDKRK